MPDVFDSSNLRPDSSITNELLRDILEAIGELTLEMRAIRKSVESIESEMPEK